MSEKVDYQVIRTFGPSIFKIKIPKYILDNINEHTDLDNLDFNIKDNQIIINTESPNRSLPLIMEKLNTSKVTINNIEIKKNTLEQVFLKLTKNNAINK